jgi:hypothetical protein
VRAEWYSRSRTFDHIIMRIEMLDPHGEGSGTSAFAMVVVDDALPHRGRQQNRESLLNFMMAEPESFCECPEMSGAVHKPQ